MSLDTEIKDRLNKKKKERREAKKNEKDGLEIAKTIMKHIYNEVHSTKFLKNRKLSFEYDERVDSVNIFMKNGAFSRPKSVLLCFCISNELGTPVFRLNSSRYTDEYSNKADALNSVLDLLVDYIDEIDTLGKTEHLNFF